MTYNVIPDAVHLKGSARWFTDEVGKTLREGVERVSKQIALAFGATAEVTFQQTCIATINEPAGDGVDTHGRGSCRGSQCRALSGQAIDGRRRLFVQCFSKRPAATLSSAPEKSPQVPPLHNPRYDFNDRILPIGAAYWATLVEQSLR